MALSTFIDADAYFGFLGSTDFGISDRLNSVIKIGYTREEEGSVYLGLEGRILILKRLGGTDYFTLTLGGHYNKENPGVDLGLSIGNIFNTIDNYFGLDFDLDFIENEIIYPGDFILGIKFKPFKNNSSIVVEGGIPVTSFSSYKLGLSWRLNL